MNPVARSTVVRPTVLMKLAAAAIVFSAVVAYLVRFIESHPHSRWGGIAATVPVLAVALIVAAVMSKLEGRDEREARMHLEALAFAFLTSQLVLSTYAFMAYIGLVELQLEMFMPMMVLLWVVGLARSAWKYR